MSDQKQQITLVLAFRIVYKLSFKIKNSNFCILHQKKFTFLHDNLNTIRKTSASINESAEKFKCSLIQLIFVP